MTATWVLLRGLGREAAHWGDFPDRLSSADAGARVVTVDLPGAGALAHQRAVLRVQDAAATCRAQLRATGVAPPYRLFGLSLGGMVASAWAHGWPQEVSHCVLVNISARSLGPLSWRLRPSAWAELLRVLLAPGDPEPRGSAHPGADQQPARVAGRDAAALGGHPSQASTDADERGAPSALRGTLPIAGTATAHAHADPGQPGVTNWSLHAAPSD